MPASAVADACTILADPKIKMVAAKGAACFGTAGWHSQVCVILCMMEFEGKYAQQPAACVYSVYQESLKSSVFFTCVHETVGNCSYTCVEVNHCSYLRS
jgi:hypothetical protein